LQSQKKGRVNKSNWGSFQRRLDTILTHKIYGVLIFLGVIWLVFQATFGLGYYPMIWIEKLIFLINDVLTDILPENFIKSLLLSGILKGVGGVIIFLPNIVILFFLLSLMEETGYMARVTLVMDKVMKPLGLNGRSFISLVMGFGCNVPAIMAARKIENRNSRLITVLINPLMSCSSRFTVYVLFISAFFPDHSGTVLFLIYLFSVVIATLLALTLKKFIFKKTHENYNPVLPSYSFPPIRRIFKSIWISSKMFLKKVAGAILIASVIIWFLGYFPRDDSGNTNIEKSYIGRIGKFIEPAISPLGFDWKMGISIISGIAAKETVVGTLSELYESKHLPGDDKSNLIRSLKSQKYTSGDKSGQSVFTPIVALSFMFFISLYTPCIATISSIRKTTNSRKWTFFVIVYTTLLAWIVSFAIYQIGSLMIK
jgi:ferrous iron transport protein B